MQFIIRKSEISVLQGIFIEDDAVERKIRANSRTISMNAAGTVDTVEYRWENWDAVEW